MTATSYTDQQNYIKFLSQKAKSQKCGEGCGCDSCSSGSAQDCSCCPPGLVAIYDDKGQHLGCLTPNDAELYKKNILTCQDGYVKLFNNTTGEFLGCVSESEYAALNEAVNGPHVTDPVGLAIIPDTSTMSVDEQVQYYGRFTPDNTTNQDVVWTIDNAAVASVDANGLVTAHGEGTATLRATSVADSDIYADKVLTITAES